MYVIKLRKAIFFTSKLEKVHITVLECEANTEDELLYHYDKVKKMRNKRTKMGEECEIVVYKDEEEIPYSKIRKIKLDKILKK